MSFCTEDVIVRSCRIDHWFSYKFCDFALLRAAWQWIGDTRISKISKDTSDTRLFQSMIHHPTLKKYHSSNLQPVGLQETVQTRNCKVLILFLGQWCKSSFWKPTKKPSKIFSNHQHFLRKHPKIHQNHGNSFMLHFVPEKIFYKNVNSWIQRDLLFCNTLMNFDHKIKVAYNDLWNIVKINS